VISGAKQNFGKTYSSFCAHVLEQNLTLFQYKFYFLLDKDEENQDLLLISIPKFSLLKVNKQKFFCRAHSN
jgi:hypothetical protein